MTKKEEKECNGCVPTPSPMLTPVPDGINKNIEIFGRKAFEVLCPDFDILEDKFSVLKDLTKIGTPYEFWLAYEGAPVVGYKIESDKQTIYTVLQGGYNAVQRVYYANKTSMFVGSAFDVVAQEVNLSTIIGLTNIFPSLIKFRVFDSQELESDLKTAQSVPFSDCKVRKVISENERRIRKHIQDMKMKFMKTLEKEDEEC